jgi:hypothetical protein
MTVTQSSKNVASGKATGVAGARLPAVIIYLAAGASPYTNVHISDISFRLLARALMLQLSHTSPIARSRLFVFSSSNPLDMHSKEIARTILILSYDPFVRS